MQVADDDGLAVGWEFFEFGLGLELLGGCLDFLFEGLAGDSFCLFDECLGVQGVTVCLLFLGLINNFCYAFFGSYA